MNALETLMREDLSGPVPQGLDCLLMPIRQRFGASLLGVLLYGSCRRRARVDEGLVDLLVIVSGYGQAHGRGMAAILNRLLPPNVYYLEAASPGGRLRCKYAVISLDQLSRRLRAPVDLYFWARFTQPCRLVCSLQVGLAEQLAAARAAAATHFAARVSPRLPATVNAIDFWSFALACSYRCELRPERPEAAQGLVEADADYWQRLSAALDPAMPSGNHGLSESSARIARLRARSGWMVRRVTGKLYNLARLFKAAGTFSQGIDYILWKVERHSGVRIEPTERMRRYPRLAAWGLAWRLWRQRGFR